MSKNPIQSDPNYFTRVGYLEGQLQLSAESAREACAKGIPEECFLRAMGSPLAAKEGDWLPIEDPFWAVDWRLTAGLEQLYDLLSKTRGTASLIVMHEVRHIASRVCYASVLKVNDGQVVKCELGAVGPFVVVRA